MTTFEKAAYAAGGLVALLILSYLFASWWTSRIPRRPENIAENAVFLWAPAVGVPIRRRGDWISCAEREGHDYCTLSNIDGTKEYAGEFVAYGDKRGLADDQLKIDVNKARRDAVWIGGIPVPLVYLQNGRILVPASEYDEADRLLGKLRRFE